MGYVIATGACITCGRLFQFNPHRVPSTRTFTGEREPVCSTCMEIVNRKRSTLGMPPFEIAPDAYEAISEEEL